MVKGSDRIIFFTRRNVYLKITRGKSYFPGCFACVMWRLFLMLVRKDAHPDDVNLFIVL